jgi:hypothetical protein
VFYSTFLVGYREREGNKGRECSILLFYKERNRGIRKKGKDRKGKGRKETKEESVLTTETEKLGIRVFYSTFLVGYREREREI